MPPTNLLLALLIFIFYAACSRSYLVPLSKPYGEIGFFLLFSFFRSFVFNENGISHTNLTIHVFHLCLHHRHTNDNIDMQCPSELIIIVDIFQLNFRMSALFLCVFCSDSKFRIKTLSREIVSPQNDEYAAT